MLREFKKEKMKDFYQYLEESVNLKEFSSSADITTMLKLAELDLENGISIGDLFECCCECFPKKEALEKLIELAKRSESESRGSE